MLLECANNIQSNVNFCQGYVHPETILPPKCIQPGDVSIMGVRLTEPIQRRYHGKCLTDGPGFVGVCGNRQRFTDPVEKLLGDLLGLYEGLLTRAKISARLQHSDHSRGRWPYKN